MRPTAAGDRARPPDGPVAHLVAAVAGIAAAGTGTLVHRWQWADLPAGLVLGLLAVVVGSVFARAVARGTGVFGYLLAAFLTTQAMTFLRPGGDVLVTGEPIGYVWLCAVPVVALAAVVTPRRWFVELPEGHR